MPGPDSMPGPDTPPMVDAVTPMPGVQVRVSDNDSFSSTLPHLVWTGTEFAIAWQDARNPGNEEIYFARLSANGTKLTGDLRASNTAGDSQRPSLVRNTSGFGVAWQNRGVVDDDVYFARLDAAGAKIGVDVQLTSDAGNSVGPMLVWRGTEYGVVWYDDRNANLEMLYATMTPGGAKVLGDVTVGSAVGAAWNPYSIWADNAYAVAFEDANDIWFGRMGTSGSFQGSQERITGGAGTVGNPALAWTGSEYGVVWDEDRGTGFEVWFARLNSAGVVQPPIRKITNVSADSLRPDIVWANGEYGVAWQDQRNGNQDIYFVRLDNLGVQQMGSLQQLTDSSSKSYRPTLAHSGTNWAVAWHDDAEGAHEVWFMIL